MREPIFLGLFRSWVTDVAHPPHTDVLARKIRRLKVHRGTARRQTNVECMPPEHRAERSTSVFMTHRHWVMAASLGIVTSWAVAAGAQRPQTKRPLDTP